MRLITSVIILLGITGLLSGCACRKPNLIGRWSKTTMASAAEEEEEVQILLEPRTIAKTAGGIEITVTHFAQKDLDIFFSEEGPLEFPRKINPYLSDFAVFYVKIANQSGGKIKVTPEHFVLLDNCNRQYEFLSPDQISEFLNARSKTYAVAKATGDNAPGIYGAPARVASTLAATPIRRRVEILRHVTLHGGMVYHRVVYDGFVAFLRPRDKVEKLTLVLPDVQTDFSATGTPQNSFNFEFAFTWTNE